MSNLPVSARETPGRGQAFAFALKTRVFQVKRGFAEMGRRPPRHVASAALADAPVVAEARAPLWRDSGPAEFPLTAGKVENLRRAARAFQGLTVPAGATFSFWRQLGRTTRRKGFTRGRELREGCLVPSVGGGLCQLSGLLYQAALTAGHEIVERHGHSRVLPGSAAEQDLDATVFWNYVDLRFRAAHDWRLEVELSAADLIVRIRARRAGLPIAPTGGPASPLRAAPSGDCLSCGMTSCFRHPSATATHRPGTWHSSFLLDARWPEFDRWCGEHTRDGDRWFVPLDGHRWRKPRYQWSPPPGTTCRTATFQTLLRSFRQRRLPAQGAFLQKALLRGDAALARRYASQLDPACRHVVVSQNLLPHLWKAGVLGGRSFDVLMQRWPLAELQRRLDEAKAAHPASTTLGDFRADPELVRAESAALAAAGRLVTPHRGIARHAGEKAWLLEWEMPEPLERDKSPAPAVFFPASRLGRKGAFELANAFRRGLAAELLCFGRASEGAGDPFAGLPWVPADAAALARADALVLPAWIEHQPRLALLALASGIPVVATAACGLHEHPLLHELAGPDAVAVHEALQAILHSWQTDSGTTIHQVPITSAS